MVVKRTWKNHCQQHLQAPRPSMHAQFVCRASRLSNGSAPRPKRGPARTRLAATVAALSLQAGGAAANSRAALRCRNACTRSGNELNNCRAALLLQLAKWWPWNGLMPAEQGSFALVHVHDRRLDSWPSNRQKLTCSIWLCVRTVNRAEGALDAQVDWGETGGGEGSGAGHKL